jgi:hypothetical protein
MAKLYVTEYADSGFLAGPVAVGKAPAITDQTVAIGGTTTQSSAFANNTRLVRLHTDAICSIQIASNPTATTSTARMAANQTEYFQVTPGHKVAVITNT